MVAAKRRVLRLAQKVESMTTSHAQAQQACDAETSNPNGSVATLRNIGGSMPSMNVMVPKLAYNSCRADSKNFSQLNLMCKVRSEGWLLDSKKIATTSSSVKITISKQCPSSKEKS